jgi:CspA family cold shock protein
MSNEGRVKWFNRVGGYGFIVDLTSKEEFFVHHSDLNAATDVYRYLCEGEYVSFDVVEKEGKQQASNVRGIKGFELLCEVPRKPLPVKSRNGKPKGKRSAAAAPAEDAAAEN